MKYVVIKTNYNKKLFSFFYLIYIINQVFNSLFKNVIIITRFVSKMQFDAENVDIESCMRSVQKDVCFLMFLIILARSNKRSREGEREKISPATKVPASGAELFDGARPMTPLGNEWRDGASHMIRQLTRVASIGGGRRNRR
ncbi:hypothetical protein ALC56_03286 [Trachymyrmex septentrionalis]|uniref:Uncharacterized protein n=1 Tax=Trachymyrmex septentrionalis TaxID=34720 RepID=A0A195FNW5_9HYME|nr:hypothetical protein ALC56_03286 [Trachymyrmex septentrionalis]